MSKSIAEKTRDFVSSPEGQKSINAALDKAAQLAEELERLSEIDPRKLQEPMTI